MFVFEGNCLLCDGTRTKSRPHWCIKYSIIGIISVIDNYGQSLFSTDLVNYLIQKESPLKFSRSRVFSALLKLAKDNYIRILPAPIDPRKNIIGMTREGMVAVSTIKQQYNRKVKDLMDNGIMNKKISKNYINLIDKIIKDLNKLIQNYVKPKKAIMK